jgi:enamine deaminase RidA (YjgF/YER057c/UK114 family)
LVIVAEYIPPPAPEGAWRERLDAALSAVFTALTEHGEARAAYVRATYVLAAVEAMVYGQLPHLYDLGGECTNPVGDQWSIPAYRARAVAEAALADARNGYAAYARAVARVQSATATVNRAANANHAAVRAYEQVRREYLAQARTRA